MTPENKPSGPSSGSHATSLHKNITLNRKLFEDIVKICGFFSLFIIIVYFTQIGYVPSELSFKNVILQVTIFVTFLLFFIPFLGFGFIGSYIPTRIVMFFINKFISNTKIVFDNDIGTVVLCIFSIITLILQIFLISATALNWRLFLLSDYVGFLLCIFSLAKPGTIRNENGAQAPAFTPPTSEQKFWVSLKYILAPFSLLFVLLSTDYIMEAAGYRQLSRSISVNSSAFNLIKSSAPDAAKCATQDEDQSEPRWIFKNVDLLFYRPAEESFIQINCPVKIGSDIKDFRFIFRINSSNFVKYFKI